MLPDGSYEGVVVDVTEADGAVLSIVVATGDHKGDVVDVRSSSAGDDALEMLGMPCVLTVVDGQPTVIFD